MAVTGAAIAAGAGGNPVKRVGAYVKAHWKELLALVLAAIPALFIVFHKGTQQAATQLLTLPPLGTGTSAGADPSQAIPPATSSRSSAPAAAAAAVTSAAASAVKAATSSSSSGVSVNGSNPTDVTPPAKSQPVPPAAKKVPPTPPATRYRPPRPSTSGRSGPVYPGSSAVTPAPAPLSTFNPVRKRSSGNQAVV